MLTHHGLYKLPFEFAGALLGIVIGLTGPIGVHLFQKWMCNRGHHVRGEGPHHAENWTCYDENGVPAVKGVWCQRCGQFLVDEELDTSEDRYEPVDPDASARRAATIRTHELLDD